MFRYFGCRYNNTGHKYEGSMTIHKVRIIASLLLMGLIFIMFSCKTQKEETITDETPVDNIIRLSDAQIQLANINIAEVREGSVGCKLSLTGVLKVNEQSVVSVSSRVPGRIEKLYFKNTGETVKKGDKLYEYYSDDLVSAQKEYFTLQSNNWNFSKKYEPSLAIENKLLLMGMIPSQIEQLGKDGKVLFRVDIYSTVEGKIRSVNVSEGQYIREGQTLFELAGDNNLWLEAQVYPGEIKFLKTGMPATATIPLAHEMKVNCNIGFINPSFETGRNISLVRAVINNPDNILHPGMLAILNVQIQMSHGIIIPSSAVISGVDGDRVWIREESGEFSCRMVTTGLQSGDSTLVLAGLGKSDKIVSSGAYLINSEMKLKHGTESHGETNSLNKKNEKAETETADN